MFMRYASSCWSVWSGLPGVGSGTASAGPTVGLRRGAGPAREVDGEGLRLEGRPARRRALQPRRLGEPPVPHLRRAEDRQARRPVPLRDRRAYPVEARIHRQELPHAPPNSVASSTPAVDADRLYVCWGSPAESVAMALDHEGKTLWHRDLGPYTSQHGFGISPILHDGMVVLAHQPDGKGTLFALDARTGAVRWTVPREGKNATYSTPCVLNQPARATEPTSCSPTGSTAFRRRPPPARSAGRSVFDTNRPAGHRFPSDRRRLRPRGVRLHLGRSTGSSCCRRAQDEKPKENCGGSRRRCRKCQRRW